MNRIKSPFRAWRDVCSSHKSLLSSALIFAAAILFAVLITLFAFQSYRVYGDSMDDTLFNNDRLIIDKIPRTISRITGHAYIPHRGDIVVFDQNGLYSTSPAEGKQLIKRVVGLPGERIMIKDGKITIYNNSHPQGFDPDKSGLWHLQDSFTSGSFDITLGSNQLFVCGDNRTNSTDSRVFGPINSRQIIGKLVVRVLPVGNVKVF